LRMIVLSMQAPLAEPPTQLGVPVVHVTSELMTVENDTKTEPAVGPPNDAPTNAPYVPVISIIALLTIWIVPPGPAMIASPPSTRVRSIVICDVAPGFAPANTA